MRLIYSLDYPIEDPTHFYRTQRVATREEDRDFGEGEEMEDKDHPTSQMRDVGILKIEERGNERKKPLVEETTTKERVEKMPQPNHLMDEEPIFTMHAIPL